MNSEYRAFTTSVIGTRMIADNWRQYFKYYNYYMCVLQFMLHGCRQIFRANWRNKRCGLFAITIINYCQFNVHSLMSSIKFNNYNEKKEIQSRIYNYPNKTGGRGLKPLLSLCLHPYTKR